MHKADDFVFFWKISDRYGWASQWYRSPFTARIELKTKSGAVVDSEREVTFSTAEHWMMACKALLFSDTAIFERVLETDSMRDVKALGRKVRGFDESVWVANRALIVFEGNRHKFSQNGELKRKLLGTGDRMIVEASPMDRIWGIGYGERKALEKRDKWGLNLLGQALVKVRETLREEQEASVNHGEHQDVVDKVQKDT